MGNTNIPYLDKVWNVTAGCSPVSPACDHCYAARITQRFYPGSNLVTAGKFNGRVITLPHKLDEPLHWRKPQRIGVCFMSDFLHPLVPTMFQSQALGIIAKCPQHQFFILSKREQYLEDWSWPDNVWLGVTVESPDQLYRLDDLRETPAAHKWVSIEPMLSEIDLTPDLDFLDWVVFGGESGIGARKSDSLWFHELILQCRDAAVPFYFKQYGSAYKDPPPMPGWWHQLPEKIGKEKGK